MAKNEKMTKRQTKLYTKHNIINELETAGIQTIVSSFKIPVYLHMLRRNLVL